MKKISALTNEQREFIFKETAYKMNVQPVVIEKDYWVCLVLDFLFNHSSFKDAFIFKGGTSLSKCYGIIERFSEDIDLILKWSTLGIEKEEIYKVRSKTQNSKFAENLNSKCIQYLKDNFIEKFLHELNEYLGYEIEAKFDEFDKQTINIFYPSIYRDEYIKPFIRLEIGPVSLQNPEVTCSIKPYCANYYSRFFDYFEFNVPTISIERTFFEKLLILSNENDRPLDLKRPSRYSRHYYDVCKIFESSYKEKILSNKELFDEIKVFKNLFYRSGWSKYDSVTLKNIVIVPNASLQEFLKRDYKMMENMFFGKHPSFDELINKINEVQKTLNNL